MLIFLSSFLFFYLYCSTECGSSLKYTELFFFSFQQQTSHKNGIKLLNVNLIKGHQQDKGI